jgi:Fe2+ or Zn2+ uptake regulation protein
VATGRTRTRLVSQGRRGSKRDAILKLVQESDGLTRGEILEHMGLKGDKSGEMSVSNALTALTKSKQVSRRDRKYVAA